MQVFSLEWFKELRKDVEDGPVMVSAPSPVVLLLEAALRLRQPIPRIYEMLECDRHFCSSLLPCRALSVVAAGTRPLRAESARGRCDSVAMIASIADLSLAHFRSLPFCQSVWAELLRLADSSLDAMVLSQAESEHTRHHRHQNGNRSATHTFSQGCRKEVLHHRFLQQLRS